MTELLADPLGVVQRAQAEGFDHEEWAHQCHAASLQIVLMTGVGRVARGGCPGVAGQHSWVVLGDPYDKDAQVIDPTLWSYDRSVHGIWTGTAKERPHTPHGSGSIWAWGRPDYPEDEPLELQPPEGGWSQAAERFLDVLGPLDRKGWIQLAHAPVEFWPAGEIFAAMEAHPLLKGRVPIDIIGMTTDLNPNGIYLPEHS